MYDYRQALYEDIANYIVTEGITDFSEESYEEVYDALWVEDSVTGNGSDACYTEDAMQAREYLRGNEELFWEMHCEFDRPVEDFFIRPCVADVCIRCYLLGEMLWEVFQSFKKLEENEIQED